MTTIPFGMIPWPRDSPGTRAMTPSEYRASGNALGISFLSSVLIRKACWSGNFWSCFSLTSNQSQDDLVTFEVGPATSDTQWEARVRDAMRQLSTAAGQPELSIRCLHILHSNVVDPDPSDPLHFLGSESVSEWPCQMLRIRLQQNNIHFFLGP